MTSCRRLELTNRRNNYSAFAVRKVSVVKWGKVFQGSGEGSWKPKAQIESRDMRRSMDNSNLETKALGKSLTKELRKRRWDYKMLQHLSMRGKRLLARMIVGRLVLSGSAGTRLETRSPPPLLVTAPAVTVSPPILPTSPATHGELSFAPRRSSEHLLHREVRASLRLHKHNCMMQTLIAFHIKLFF
ncbi:hypothetical protein J6590_024290 [Homalodisca vitripennis]|nr:hypothetical protein J6590_024290 [Homalodisca vitripennis]